MSEGSRNTAHDRATATTELRRSYDEKFFAGHAANFHRSATAVVPLIIEMFGPTSVIDVGCGIGIWLRAFADLGVTQLLGVDGPHVEPASLRIPAEQFRAHDLRLPLPDLGQFDLAMSLEVAEHLPADVAAAFVADLTRLAPIVVFSAAIPGQGGTEHINEQWPEYWQALFEKRGYVQLDPLRPLIWHDERVDWWYRQNLFVYVAEDFLKESVSMKHLPRAVGEERMEVLSRHILRQHVDPAHLSLRQILQLLRRAIARSLKHRLFR